MKGILKVTNKNKIAFRNFLQNINELCGSTLKAFKFN